MWICTLCAVGGGPQDCAEETIDKYDKTVRGVVGMLHSMCDEKICVIIDPGVVFKDNKDFD